MALFYAAECGLKFIFMKDNNVRLASELKSRIADFLNRNRRDIDLHDIEMLCEAVKILAVDTGPVPGNFVLTNASPHEPFRIHEAARYGVKLPCSYVTQVENWLRNVNDAVHNRLLNEGWL